MTNKGHTDILMQSLPTIRVNAYINGNPITIKNSVWIWKQTREE